MKVTGMEEENMQGITNIVPGHSVDCDVQNVETGCLRDKVRVVKGARAIVPEGEVGHRRSNTKPLTKRKVTQPGGGGVDMPTIVNAVRYPAHRQNPYRFVFRMIELSLEKGLYPQTNQQVLGIFPAALALRERSRWHVKTDRGTVRAKQVILTTMPLRTCYTLASYRLVGTKLLRYNQEVIYPATLRCGRRRHQWR
jgi:hypothetical protein